MTYLNRLLAVASAAFFIASSALAQNAGTVTANAFAIGKGAGTSGYASLLCTSAQLAVGQSAAAPICQTIAGDVTINASGVTAIGVNKVTNAMFATMAANTTKCNATAGSAVPTDCTGSTMRTNLGLVIGTNVEAWDADLDCLAGISSTGFIKRSGAGTCSAGSFALSDLPTGTQDTVLGYFGSTTASALAINNCSNALTYSTSTHTFGCNSIAGTGTVTSVGTAGLATGGAITATGTVTVTAAVQSDMESASSNSVAVTPGTTKYHPAVAKAWARLDGKTGSTCAVTSGFGVTSCSRASAGTYTVTFSTAFSSATAYSCTVFGTQVANLLLAPLILSAPTTTTINFQIYTIGSTPTPTDADYISVQCFGDQ